jgi:hypothetical protein
MSATTTGDLSWSYAGAPFSIHAPLLVVQRLQTAIGQHGETEAGGVLLGMADLSRSRVEIRDFTFVPSSASDGVYELDIEQLQRLQFPAGSVIGYFRTHPQGALELRASELDLVKRHFADPTNVVLLIQPRRKTAGFFFWCGDFFTPVSFRDFTFEVPASAPIPQVTCVQVSRKKTFLSLPNLWAGSEY